MYIYTHGSENMEMSDDGTHTVFSHTTSYVMTQYLVADYQEWHSERLDKTSYVTSMQNTTCIIHKTKSEGRNEITLFRTHHCDFGTNEQ